MPDSNFDIITLFHVFEHFVNPLQDLASLYEKLKPGGKIIIEVPHARDFLLHQLDLDAFKAFTFWSEHLILHTKESLTAFLKQCGFVNIGVEHFQRYPLANHLYWLAKQQPEGHLIWANLLDGKLDKVYAKKLAELYRSDTIIAGAEKS